MVSKSNGLKDWEEQYYSCLYCHTCKKTLMEIVGSEIKQLEKNMWKHTQHTVGIKLDKDDEDDGKLQN